MSLNWRLALTALAIIPGIMLASFGFTRRIRPIYRAVRKDIEIIDGRVGETFSGIRVVRAFGRELRELADYMLGRHAVLRKELFAHRRELVIWTSWGLITSAVNVVIVWYGGYLNVMGDATVGDIMAFQWYVPADEPGLEPGELVLRAAALARGDGAGVRVLAMENDKPDRPDARVAPHTVHEIRFEEVEFEYRAKDSPWCRDFNVVVPGGSVVALVGRSGAGKTTVTDLVARFHDPTRGRILLNGTDIREFKLASYRHLLAIVQQDVFLFDGSAADNIAYGRRDATRAEVEDAAQRERPRVHRPAARSVRDDDRRARREALRRPAAAARHCTGRARLSQILILDEAPAISTRRASS